MICPRCNGDLCRRSKRRSALDLLVGLAGLRPWRCRSCERRFYALAVPLAYQKYAHCERCGNLDLQRISGDHVTEGWLLWLFRLLHLPAYRCAPCRYRFFSLRLYRRIPTIHSESPTT